MKLTDFNFTLLDDVVVNGRCPRNIGRNAYSFWMDDYYLEISLDKGFLEVWSHTSVQSYYLDDVSSDMEEEYIEILFAALDAVEGCTLTKSQYFICRWLFIDNDGVYVHYRSIRDLKYIRKTKTGYTIVGVVYPRVL